MPDQFVWGDPDYFGVDSVSYSPSQNRFKSYDIYWGSIGTYMVFCIIVLSYFSVLDYRSSVSDIIFAVKYIYNYL